MKARINYPSEGLNNELKLNYGLYYLIQNRVFSVSFSILTIGVELSINSTNFNLSFHSIHDICLINNFYFALWFYKCHFDTDIECAIETFGLPQIFSLLNMFVLSLSHYLSHSLSLYQNFFSAYHLLFFSIYLSREVDGLGE